jgi:hypothetical protein
MNGNLKGPADIKYEAVKVFLKDIKIDQTLSIFLRRKPGDERMK